MITFDNNFLEKELKKKRGKDPTLKNYQRFVIRNGKGIYLIKLIPGG